jgi:ankyrin repeat protein
LINKDSKLIDIRTKNGRTPAHTAALHGHLSVLQLILDRAELEKPNGDRDILSNKDACGITPFMDACQADHDEIVRYLVEKYHVIY